MTLLWLWLRSLSGTAQAPQKDDLQLNTPSHYCPFALTSSDPKHCSPSSNHSNQRMNAFSIDSLQVAKNSTIQGLYCAADDYPECFGLCPNPDLSGIGVRIAFYSQSFMYAMLITLSPEDAAAGAWASTILTGALVIPALRAKMQRELTLHHASLVLNFCTLSTIASVAAAPMVPIWRVVKSRKEQDERARGRIILSMALLAQIVLQWIWAVMMFVDPFYAQNPCSGNTTIVYIAGFQKADDINKRFSSWAVWLLLCISSSLIFGVVMVFSCPSPAHEIPIDYDHIKSSISTIKGRINFWLDCSKYFLYPKGDDLLWERWWIRLSKLFAFAIVVLFITLSELQITENNVLSGENEIRSFSQSAAVFLALSQIWPIGLAWLRKHENPLLPVHLWNHYYDASGSGYPPSLRQVPSFPDTPTPLPDPFSPGRLLSPPPDSFGMAARNMRDSTYDPYGGSSSTHVTYQDPFAGHSPPPSSYGPPSPRLCAGGGALPMPAPILAVNAASDDEESLNGTTAGSYDRPSSSRHERRSSPPSSSPTRRPAGFRSPIQRNCSGSDLSSLGQELDANMEGITLTAPSGTSVSPVARTLSPPTSAVQRPRHRSSSSLQNISRLSDGGLGIGGP